jgi:hypothetical protein
MIIKKCNEAEVNELKELRTNEERKREPAEAVQD